MNSKLSEYFSVSAFQRFSVYLLILSALLLRLPMLGYSFYGDEAFTLLRDSHRFITDSEDRFRPVFFSLVFLWKQIGFQGEIGLRLLPLLFGIAQIPFAYWIGKKLSGRSLGLTFALLMAASPMLIEFSQELRMYSLVALIALAQVWVLLKLLEEDNLSRWIAFTALAVVGVYTHLHYWLFLAGMALTFMREWRTLPVWKGFTALGVTAVIYALNYQNILVFVARRGGEYATHTSGALPKLLAAFTVGFNYFLLPEQGLGRQIAGSDIRLNLPLVILAAVPALIILWHIVKLHFRSPAAVVVREEPEANGAGESTVLRPLMLCHELFTVPVLLAFIASIVTHKYWLQPKYLIFSAPFALLFIAIAFHSMRSRLLRRLTGLFAFLVFAVALMHFWNPEQFGRRENWRAAASVLRESLDANSQLVLLYGNYSLLTYYAPELAGRWITAVPPRKAEDAPEFESGLRSQLANASEIYYLRYDIAQNIDDPRDLLPQALDNLATPAGVIQFNPRFRLYRWQK